MARDRGLDDELPRWAAAHAPSLLERAEADAVAILRAALVDAALEGREDREQALHKGHGKTSFACTPPPQPGRGGLTWVYCVLRATDDFPAGLTGVDPDDEVRAVQSAGLIALVSSVAREDFGSEPLHRNLNDIRWLERVARAHESVLDATLQMSTIVPLRMCTLYEDASGVRKMLEREHDALADALEELEGREEWAVKVLIDEERLMQSVQRSSERGRGLEEELEGRGEGGAYMLHRRLDRELRASADALASEVSQQVHARLQDWSLDAVTRPPQNRELSGHYGRMLLNGAYLVERERIDELRALVAEFEVRYQELGVRIELTGPWPPYNFVSAGSSVEIA